MLEAAGAEAGQLVCSYVATCQQCFIFHKATVSQSRDPKKAEADRWTDRYGQSGKSKCSLGTMREGGGTAGIAAGH